MGPQRTMAFAKQTASSNRVAGSKSSMLGVITLHTFVSVISRVDTLMEDQGLNPEAHK